MSLPWPIHPYHFHADLIWWDGPFKASLRLLAPAFRCTSCWVWAPVLMGGGSVSYLMWLVFPCLVSLFLQQTDLVPPSSLTGLPSPASTTALVKYITLKLPFSPRMAKYSNRRFTFSSDRQIHLLLLLLLFSFNISTAADSANLLSATSSIGLL